MKDHIKEALDASIAKWEKNASVLCSNKVLIGAEDCPLCLLFNNDETDEGECCIGCPVYEKTGKVGCKDTPYYLAQIAFVDWSILDKNEDYELFITAARDEVTFLKSLRVP
jgi:hypothetical protein